MISAVSVKDRLKNQAVAGGKTFQEALTAYGLERTVYRLSVSEYVEQFTLKGGIFLYALFEGEFARATRDIDLLAKNMPNNVEDMKKVFENIFSIKCDDALRYDLDTLDVTDITEFKEYHGVNVSIMAYLDRTKVPVSIDIGFGDVIYPDRVKMEFPVLLDMEVAEIYAYSISSVISEKFEAIVSLGDANSRYKDFYDIYILADRYDFNGTELKEAVKETFEHKPMKEKAGEYHIIHIHIPVSPSVVRNSNRIYDRNNDADIDITNFSDLVFQCYARKQSTYYVNKVFPHFQVSDLQSDLIERARKMAVSRKRLEEGATHEWADMEDEELLRTSSLILTDENGKKGITLAAILLFGTDNMISSVCAHHKTDCIVRVYNTDRYDDRDVILTNLLDSYDRMFAFGQKHLNNI